MAASAAQWDSSSVLCLYLTILSALKSAPRQKSWVNIGFTWVFLCSRTLALCVSSFNAWQQWQQLSYIFFSSFIIVYGRRISLVLLAILSYAEATATTLCKYIIISLGLWTICQHHFLFSMLSHSHILGKDEGHQSFAYILVVLKFWCAKESSFKKYRFIWVWDGV